MIRKHLIRAAFVAGAGAALAQGAEVSEHRVFFGIDRAAFGEDGIETLTRASRAAIGEGFGVVIAAGHTDTLGDAAYNLDLSRRRARAIAEELIARGVPRAVVEQAAFGQTELAVPTGDGEAEVANRRVVITLAAPGMLTAPDPDRPIVFPTP